MRKFCLLLLFIFSYNPLAAQQYKNFDLDACIARHPITSSFDHVSRRFTSSDILQKQIASLSEKLVVVEKKLAGLTRLQTDGTSTALTASAPIDEDDFWQKSRVMGLQEREFKTEKFDLIQQKHELEQLLTRDIGIIPDINGLVKDIRSEFADDSIYLNYLPAPLGPVTENWLTSPLQIYFWNPQERNLKEYLDNACDISLIFPESRRAVVYQRGSK